MAEQKPTLASTKACAAEVNTFTPEVRGSAVAWDPVGITCSRFKATCFLLLGVPPSIRSSGEEPIEEKRSRKIFQPKPIPCALSPASQTNKYIKQSSGRQAMAASVEVSCQQGFWLLLSLNGTGGCRRCRRRVLERSRVWGESVLPALDQQQVLGEAGLEAAAYAMSSSILTICLEG